MKSTWKASSSESGRFRREHRWDLFGLLSGVAIVIVLVFLLDTGSLAEWVARHKQSKVDEIIVAGVAFLIGLTFFSMRRWLGLSKRIIEYEATDKAETLPDAQRI